MSTSHRKNVMTLQALLSTLAMVALGATPEASPAAEPVASETSATTVRDRLWIFSVAAGLNDSYLELGGVRGGSRMTPAEGAFWLGVPNLLLIREHNNPPLPNLESWRAKTSFEQYA